MDSPKKKKKTNKIYTEAEKEFIRLNYNRMSDKEMSGHLDRPIDGITTQRKKLGLTKKSGRPSYDKEEMSVSDYFNHENTTTPMKNLSSKDKRDLAEKLFVNSSDYERFKKQFTDDEMVTYIEKFSNYLAEWEVILPQEKEQLHTAIKEIILQDRLLRSTKLNQEIREKLGQLELRRMDLATVVDKTDAEKKDYEELTVLIKNLTSTMEPADYYSKQYDESIKRMSVAYKQLNMTREQRQKNNRESGITLEKIVQQLADADTRRIVGEEVALIAATTDEYKKNQKRKGLLYGDI